MILLFMLMIQKGAYYISTESTLAKLRALQYLESIYAMYLESIYMNYLEYLYELLGILLKENNKLKTIPSYFSVKSTIE